MTNQTPQQPETQQKPENVPSSSTVSPTREDYADKKAAPLLKKHHKNVKKCGDITRTMRSKLSHIMPYLQGADVFENKTYDEDEDYDLNEFLMHEMQDKALALCLEVAALKKDYDRRDKASSFRSYQKELKKARKEYDKLYSS